MDRLIFSLFVICCCTLGAWAQASPWRMDFYLGAAGYAGDIADHPLYSHNLRPAVGWGLYYQLSAPFALKSDLYHGRLSGNDRYFTTPDWPSGDRLARFTTAFTQWNLSLEYHFLESAVLGHPRKWSPYLALGGGLVYYEPSPNFGFTRNPELEHAIETDSKASYEKIAANLNLEAGLDWRIFERWSIGVNAAVHPTSTDYLDGISRAGNPNKRDWFAKAGLRLQYVFVPTPDRDGDGIADDRDECPGLPGLPELKGCPDSDRDGLHDLIDLCPLVAGSISLNGCPDRDGDGIPDKDDLCPALFGPFERGGCPLEDRDGDGIEDQRDLCPDAAGPPEREGCPTIDTDMDGILDEDDHCPLHFGLAIFNGCPDTDGDGIEDSRDACPTLFGVYTHNGCPELANPEEVAAEINRQVLLFNNGSAEIQRYGLLDQIVEFLQENPTYRLMITGFTDAEDPLNHQQLSRARARACYRYLIQQRIDEFRLEYQGLGDKPPSNGELFIKGQPLNRRVEFYLHQ